MSTVFEIANFPHTALDVTALTGFPSDVDGDTNERGALITVKHDYSEPDAAALLATLQACKPFSMIVNAQTVTVKTAPDVALIALDVDGESVDVPLTNGVGALELDLPVGGDDRTVQAVNRPVFGYRKVTVKCPL